MKVRQYSVMNILKHNTERGNKIKKVISLSIKCLLVKTGDIY